jgi:predicted Zn finger-like uncharacterized protein
MKIICDSCGTKYSISDDKVRGKVFKIRCKKCSHIIVVRGGESQDEAAAPAAAAAAVEGGGWHIVVEGEQVGPISEADVRARVERGEIRSDTYIWKEGFADWLKLSAVPEFADLVPSESGSVSIGDVFTSSDSAAQPTNGSSGRRRSGANRSLFGDGGGDVFAAPAAAAPSSASGDLFGSATAHSTSSDSRWPSSSSGGGGAAMAGHDGGRVENLTGQRHENSVLFSLSNLQSLAMPSAKPSTTALPTTAPTTEGSGLIDIRAMAANIGPAPSDGSTSSTMGGGDDLPAFGAFSPAAPVLLPMPSSSGPPWWIYLVIVGMLGLVGGIGFLAWRVISPKQVVVVKEVQVPAPAPEPSKTVASKTAGAEDKKPTTIDEKDLPPRDGQPAKEAKEGGKDEKGGKESRHHKSGSSGGGKETKKPAASEEKEKKPAGPIAGAAEPPKPKPGSLEALLNDASPTKKGPKVSDDEKKGGGGGEGAGALPKNALVAGLNGVRPKVSNCYNQFKVPGTAMVNITIGKNGKVSKAEVTGKFAGTPTGQCVEAAVKTASFPPSDGFSTPYPFQLK